jgi:hypothetical protein
MKGYKLIMRYLSSSCRGEDSLSSPWLGQGGRGGFHMKRMLGLIAVVVLAIALAGCEFDTSGLNLIDHGECVTANTTYAHAGDTITWSMDMWPNKLYGGDVPNYDRGFNIFCNDVSVDNSGIIKSTIYSMVAKQSGVYTAKAYLHDDGDLHEGYSGPVYVEAPLVITSVVPDKTISTTGVPITWTVMASGGFSGNPIFGLIYSWGVLREGSTVAISGGWKAANTFTYTPEMPGNYSVQVYVNDHVDSIEGVSGTTMVTQGLAITNVEVKKLLQESEAADKTAALVGDRIRWFAHTAGGEGPAKYTYCFDIYKDNKLIEDNSFPGGKFFGWTKTLDQPGTYWAMAYVFDGKNFASRISPATVVNGPLEFVSIKANRTTAPLGAEIIWTITTKDGLPPYTYGFELYKGTQMVSFAAASQYDRYTGLPPSVGDYFMRGFASDASGSPALKMDSAHIQVTSSSAIAVKNVHVDTYDTTIGQKITWTATAMGGSGNKTYKFNVYRNDVSYKTNAYTSSSVFSYTPTEAGVYKVQVYVKDSTGTSPAVFSAQTLVRKLVPLSGEIPAGLLIPGTLFANITLPAFVSIRVSPLPLIRPRVTNTPYASVITPEPIPVEPTDYPIYVIITGFILPTPTPVGID